MAPRGSLAFGLLQRKSILVQFIRFTSTTRGVRSPSAYSRENPYWFSFLTPNPPPRPPLCSGRLRRPSPKSTLVPFFTSSVTRLIFRSLRSLPYTHSASLRSPKSTLVPFFTSSITDVLFRPQSGLPFTFSDLSLAQLP